MEKLKTALFVCIAAIIVSCSAMKHSTTIQAKKQDTAQSQDTTQISQNRFQYLFVEALKQKMLGNTKDAVKLLSTCLELDPNSAASMYELAEIHLAANDYTSATLLLQKAVTLEPGNKWYKLLLAQIYQQTRKFDKAAAVYNDLISLYPDNLNYLYFHALMLSDAGKTDEAIDAYRQIENKVGVNEQVAVALQQLYIDAGKPKEAFAEIEKLIGSAPNESKYYGLLADLYMSQGDTAKAIENYNKIIAMDPDNGYVQFSLANYYQEKGDSTKSFEHTKTGFASKTVDVDTKLQIYLALTGKNAKPKLSDQKNEDLLKTLISSEPDDARVYLVYTEFLIEHNRIAEARVQLKKSLALNSADYTPWERLLIIDNNLQDWQALDDDAGKALEYFPSEPEVYFFKGDACLQLKKYKDAIDICTKGLDYVVDDKNLKGQLIALQGEANYDMHNLDEAFSLFDKAVELNPENYVTLNNYAYYLSLVGKDLDKAERMSGKVVQQFPKNATYLDTYAWVLFKEKNYQLAKYYMQTAIENGGDDNPVLLEHYGDILIMLQKTTEAKEYWEKAKEKGSDSTILDKKIKDLKYYENPNQ